MTIGSRHFQRSIDPAEVGRRMHAFIEELYPICRSITGEGFRETMRRIGERVPLTLHEVPTGTQAFDWTVPREWNVSDAWVKNSRGEKVIDFKKSNLHVVSYSVPVRATLRLAELKEHLFSLPEYPDFIPYRTSYYKEFWGFCLTHTQLEALEDDTYEVFIDATLSEGSLTYGECLIPGAREDEILISCHACHPSTCNDNLSGVALTTFLGTILRGLETRYSFRLLFIPGGIGSIVWLSRNEENLHRIKHGLIATCVGDPGAITYKRSRREDADIDRAAIYALTRSGSEFSVIPFSPYGYDERNFCSPAFNLPVGSLTRTTHAQFAGYHSSGDDLELVRPEYLGDSLEKYLCILDVLDKDRTYRSLNPKGEPQLGKRGLYGSMGGLQDRYASEIAMLWVLNYSDGAHSLLDIAAKSEIDFDAVCEAADALEHKGLLEELR